MNRNTAEEVLRIANKKLAETDMSVRGITNKSNVTFIGTTDEPVDSLEWHKKPSYTRHEYFRRILCEFIGSLVENGEFPVDLEALGQIVKDVCYNNAKKYLGI